MPSQIEQECVRSRRPPRTTGRPLPPMRQPGPLQRALKGTLFLTVAVLLLAAIAAVAAYVRLIHGPFSLAALKPSIERHLRAKLGGRDVTVSDVLLSLDSQGLELKLEDVSVHDANRSSVASAPFAAMQIDKMALLRGEISLNGITLIRPRINVSYDEATGLSLSFADAGKAAPNSISAPRPVPATRPEPIPPDTTASRGWQAQVTRRGDDDPGTTPAEPTGGLPQAAMVHRPEPAPPASSKNVFELLAGFMGDVAAHKDRTGGLDRMGVRNAIIVFEHAGRRSVWGVPSGDIEIKRSGPAVLLTGLTTIADAAGNNASFAFSAETAPGRRPIALTGSIRELRPEAMAELMGGIVDVGALDAPISAEGQFNLTPAGVVVDGSVAVELGRGQVDLPPQTEMAPVRIDHGRIALKVHKDHPGALIEPSTLAWGGGNEVRFRGRVAPISEGTSVWSFSLDGLGGRLLPASGKAKDTARAIDALSARGRLDASRGSVVLDSGTVNVGGLSALFELSYAAANKRAGARPDVRLAARISPGPLDGLLYLWPVNLGVDARAWMRTHLAGGRLTEGRIDYRWPPLGAESEAAGDGKGPVSIALSGEGVALAGVTPSGLVVAPKALLRLSGRSLELAMPDAELSLTGTKPLTLSQLSFEIDDIWRPDIAGKIAATMEGPLRTAARLAMTNAAVSPAMADRLERVAAKASGKLAGKLEIVVPLDGRTAKARPTGEIRIIGASLEDVAPGHDMSGGRFDIALTEKVVTARGAVQIDGVPAKLDWSHIYDADRARQLPIRLRANLDAADREKLGIRINHILRGTLQTEVLLAERENGTFHTEARIDAREAQISIESLAWVKPKGRDTQIDFEIVPSADEGVALEKLRIVGDGIAIQGRAALDRNFALRAFEFPSFSIDRVTRLSITGRLAKNNNWRVDVKGQTYEGSSLFRSLFNAGHVKGGLHVEDPNQPGVDLEAEIKTVLGFWSTRLADVRMTLSKRAGRLQSLQLDGRLVAGGELKAAIVTTTRGRRELHAFSSNAGEAFRLVGFYPNARRGRLELVVDLDGRGAAEKSGVLLVRNFDIVGDEVVREMAAAPRGGVRRRPSQRAGADGVQALSFDWMRLPFLVGNGQFILRSAELRGPVVGATLQGKADFDARRVDVSGTYVPLQGLNGALGVIPGLGQILAGPKGEGVLGMKFAVRGPMGQPDVLVNPLSLMAPGIFREIFQISNPSLEVTERSPRRAPGVTPRPRTDENRRGWANRAFGDGN